MDGDYNPFSLEFPTRRAALGLIAALPACAPLPRPLKDRMDRDLHRADPATRADTLIVLLPGAYDLPADFVREGFVQAVRARRLPVDLLLLDAHVGYYTAQQIVPRLLDEVVRPARAEGYARVWLAGISMGGYGALLFAQAHGDRIDGVFTMAAFLGRRDLPAHIAAAGGLAAWDGQLAGADAHDLALWRWLQGYGASADGRAPGHPPLWMGWGEQDRFVMSNRLVGALLPPAQVLSTDGGHQWAPWQRLWQRFLAARPWDAPTPAARPSTSFFVADRA